MSKGRVLMAMSGGVDSSVAALLLREQGYQIIGITMKVWEYDTANTPDKETGCCSLDSINDARELAVKNGFPHYTIDLQKEFQVVVNDFISEYLAGRTPNPCVLCNTKIKWQALLERADQLQCQYIATGHYARLRKQGERYIISKGVDDVKDQSYMLWGLSQENLQRTLFPLGTYQKSEIKRIAMQHGFDNLAHKRESYEICFIPDDDYRGFLRRRNKGLDKKLEGGAFVDTSGKILGYHKGYPFYTIGQRKGLNVAVGHPLYVLRIDAKTNTVVLGKKEELAENEISVRNCNLIKYNNLTENFKAVTKIRYKDAGTESQLQQAENNTIKVKFSAPVSGVAPGQSAVFYQGNDVVGGGIIV